MGFMALFDRFARVSLKDCFEDDNGLLTFVVAGSDVGKAVGKGAVTVRKLQDLLKRRVRIIGHYDDIIRFLQAVIYPLRVASIEEETSEDGPVYVLKSQDTKTKSLLIGRNAKNLRNTEVIVKRYFPLKELKVV